MTSFKISQYFKLRFSFKKSWMTMALIVISCVFLWSSFGLSRVSAWIPQLVMGIGLVFLLLQLASEVLTQKQAGPSAKSPAEAANSVPSALMWIGLMLVSVWLLGITIGAAWFCLAYLRWHAHERWPLCIGFALSLGVGVQLFFDLLMQTSLYRGLILSLLAV